MTSAAELEGGLLPQPPLHRGFPERGVIRGAVVATIGVFDGVHLGHQRLLQQVTHDAAPAGRPALITFDPHPRCIIDPAGCPPLLTSVEERAGLAALHGVRTTIAIDFTPELSTWTAERFCDRLLESLQLRRLIVGPGFAMGKGRTGDEAFLRRYGDAHGFDVASVEPVIVAGGRVSSGRARSRILAGDVDEARALLGRGHRLPGVVARGEGRGRTLGFPTANVAVASERCAPAAGVYATWLQVSGRWRRAATSIGTRPTFGGIARTIEAYVLDFDGDLYGERVKLEFVTRLREERAYPDADSLVAQMHEDVAAVRTLMAGVPEPQLAVP